MGTDLGIWAGGIGAERVSPSGVERVNMRTWVGILVSLYEESSGIERRDGGVDVQAFQGCTVEVMAVVKIVAS